MKQSRTVQLLELKSFYCEKCDGRGTSACNDCPYRPVSTQIRGNTEVFDDGKYASTLKSSAIKLYMAMFFYCDSNGYAEELSYKELSEFIGVHQKTIKASLEALCNENYINYSKKNSRYFSTSINDYDKMYQVASSGGKGYITLSKEMLHDIVSVSGLNNLRCIIKVIFNAIYNQFKSASKLAATKITFENMRKCLPHYVKPFILREAISSVKTFFNNYSESYKEFIIVLDKKYQASALKEQLKADGKLRIPKLVDKLNILTDRINKDIDRYGEINYTTTAELLQEGLLLSPVTGSIKKLDFNSSQKNDLLSLCTEYGVDLILGAIKTYYSEYIIKHIPIDNPGGLIRKIIKEFFDFKPNANLATA